jgi:TatD DNase family protein
MMNIIDSHCHLDFEPLSNDIEGAIERAGRAGVTKIINIGTSLHRSARSVELANYYPNVWASVGLHPQDVGDIADLGDTIEKLEVLAKDKRVGAIGEIGLDYYPGANDQRPMTSDQKEAQKALFIAQIELAQKLNLPIIFHVRDAWDDFLALVTSHRPLVTGVVHCFTGDEKIAQRLVNMGLYIGFTGLVTFKNANTAGIKEAAKIVPLDKLLIETDAPFLAPEPHRGSPNEPAYVIEVARKIAEIKGLSEEKIAESTTKNAEKLFNI